MVETVGSEGNFAFQISDLKTAHGESAKGSRGNFEFRISDLKTVDGRPAGAIAMGILHLKSQGSEEGAGLAEERAMDQLRIDDSK